MEQYCEGFLSCRECIESNEFPSNCAWFLLTEKDLVGACRDFIATPHFFQVYRLEPKYSFLCPIATTTTTFSPSSTEGFSTSTYSPFSTTNEPTTQAPQVINAATTTTIATIGVICLLIALTAAFWTFNRCGRSNTVHGIVRNNRPTNPDLESASFNNPFQLDLPNYETNSEERPMEMQIFSPVDSRSDSPATLLLDDETIYSKMCVSGSKEI